MSCRRMEKNHDQTEKMRNSPRKKKMNNWCCVFRAEFVPVEWKWRRNHGAAIIALDGRKTEFLVFLISNCCVPTRNWRVRFLSWNDTQLRDPHNALRFVVVNTSTATTKLSPPPPPFLDGEHQQDASTYCYHGAVGWDQSRELIITPDVSRSNHRSLRFVQDFVSVWSRPGDAITTPTPREHSQALHHVKSVREFF